MPDRPVKKRSRCRVPVEFGSQHGCRQVQINSARTSRHGGADGSDQAGADVFGTVDAVGRLGKRAGDVQLIQPFVVALFEVNDRAVAGTADLNHGKAVDGSVGQRAQAVEETGSGNGKQNSRPAGDKTAGGRSVAGRLFVTKADIANAFFCA